MKNRQKIFHHVRNVCDTVIFLFCNIMKGKILCRNYYTRMHFMLEVSFQLKRKEKKRKEKKGKEKKTKFNCEGN